MTSALKEDDDRGSRRKVQSCAKRGSSRVRGQEVTKRHGPSSKGATRAKGDRIYERWNASLIKVIKKMSQLQDIAILHEKLEYVGGA